MTESDDYYDSANSPQQNTVLKVAVVFEVIALLMILTNIPRYIEERKFIFVWVFILSLIILVIWLAAFIGAIYGCFILIMMVWVSWISFTLVWLFFVTGSITPTRGPEGLWLVENSHRMENEAKAQIEYYYHDYHSPLPDVLPRSMNNVMEHVPDHEEILYDINYIPMFMFLKLYKPWNSTLGAIIFVVTFLSVLLLFVWSSIVLKRYANVLNEPRLKKMRCQQRAECSC